MLKIVFIAALILAASSVSIACTQNQATKNGNATDCSIVRVDATKIQWGARINFNVDFNWKNTSFSNVLADVTSPRLPYPPTASQCTTTPKAYKKGESVLVNCTQTFSAVPSGYVNAVSAFEGDDYPLGFYFKVPLSSPMEEENNLQLE